MLIPHGMSNCVKHFSDILFPAEQVKKEESPSDADDRYETPILLSHDASAQVLDSTVEVFDTVNANFLSTLWMLDPRKRAGARAQDLRVRLSDAKRLIEAFKISFADGCSLANSDVVKVRRALWEIEVAASALQSEHIAESFSTCSRMVLARIEALAVMQALHDSDSAFVKTVLKAYPPQRSKKANATDYALLRRFDSGLLQVFAQKGFVICMTYQQMEELKLDAQKIPELKEFQEEALLQIAEIEAKLDEPGILAHDEAALLELYDVKLGALENMKRQIDSVNNEQGELEKAFYLRDHFYLIDAAHWPLMKRLATLLDEAGISIASMRNLNFQTMQSLFRGHFEMFCALGVIDRLSSQELYERAAQRNCDARDFLAMGRDKCQISRAGMVKLKNAIKLCPPQYTPPPKPQPVESEDVESHRPIVEKPRVRDYSIVKLDEAIEFY